MPGMTQHSMTETEQDLLRSLVAAQVAVLEGETEAISIILERTNRLAKEVVREHLSRQN